MHVEKEPEMVFPGEQEDLSDCSEVEIKLQDLIKESLKNNPLLKKIPDPKLGPIVYR